MNQQVQLFYSPLLGPAIFSPAAAAPSFSCTQSHGLLQEGMLFSKSAGHSRSQHGSD